MHGVRWWLFGLLAYTCTDAFTLHTLPDLPTCLHALHACVRVLHLPNMRPSAQTQEGQGGCDMLGSPFNRSSRPTAALP